MADTTSRVLVVDDDEAVGKVLCALLAQAGYGATLVGSGEAALVALDKTAFDLVLSDVKMPGMDGLELLRTLKVRAPEVPVVLLTAHGSVPMAVEAMREGAADFLLKPFQRDEVIAVVKRQLDASQGARDRPPASPPSKASGLSALVGSSPALEEARQLIQLAAKKDANVLIRGETGTGKELVARAIHSLSARAKGPFQRVNCGALPDTLFESEVFGYEKGAFTGAVAKKPGRVELAEGGTLFLDEVGELGAPAQVKLLRLLQEKEYERLGGTQTLNADVRIVAATHRPLEQMKAAGTFREDLFYRLAVVQITMPPLRAHPEDIPALARHFLLELGGAGASFDAGAIGVLSAHAWEGNVRELRNVIERVVVLAPGPVLSEADVRKHLVPGAAATAPAATPAAPAGTLDARRDAAEKGAVVEALDRAKGNRTLAARLLGVSRRTLYNKLEALGLE